MTDTAPVPLVAAPREVPAHRADGALPALLLGRPERAHRGGADPRARDRAVATLWRTIRIGALLGLLGAIALAAGGAIGGLRIHVVDSPSMGTAAPVGTLVLGTVRIDRLRVGDVVTYHPPARASKPYTHRVVEVVPGGVRTRGDINGSDDPWVVTPAMVDSRVLALVPGAGWLVRGAPILLGGLLVVQVLCLFLASRSARSQVRMIGASFTFAIASIVLKPFTGFVLLQSVPEAAGLKAELVSTALLPIRLLARGGGGVALRSGEVGSLLLPRDTSGKVGLSAQLALPWPGWVLLLLLCLAPVIYVTVIGVPRERDPADATD